jgi:DeoR/GlpR family transcriptional regulator of sugar metabolism
MTVPGAPDLLPDERRERVLEAVRRHGTVRVNDLADMLGVTAITVRRDIARLKTILRERQLAAAGGARAPGGR